VQGGKKWRKKRGVWRKSEKQWLKSEKLWQKKLIHHTAQDHACQLARANFSNCTDVLDCEGKVAPLQTGLELLRNIQNSPTKAIDHNTRNLWINPCESS
jgi:hypothetical protein